MKNLIKLTVIATLMLGGAMQAMDVYQEEHLCEAARVGDYQMVEALLVCGVPVDAKVEYDFTPLLYAALNGHKDICELLLAHNAQVNAKGGKDGNTPLLWAAQLGYHRKPGSTDICKLLIQNKAHVNATNNDGYTALMWAVCHPTEKEIFCDLLLAHNARVDITNANGRSPLMIAAAHRHSGICKLLIDAMLKPTKEQRDSVIALLGMMKRMKRCKDERFLISQCAFNEIMKQNNKKALAEIAKLNKGMLESELIQHMHSK